MKTSRIITLIIIFVMFSFLHVFFQTEIIKLGYQVKKSEDVVSELIDNNRILKYNIYTLESPYSLDKYVLFKNSNLRSLRPAQVLGLYPEPKAKYVDKENSKSVTRSPGFLALRRFFNGGQAEARTIK